MAASKIERLESAVLDPALPTRTRYAIACAIVGVATLIGYFWSQLPDARNLSLVFFGAILLAGAWLGTKPALVAALLSFLSYNFFLIEPRFSLHLAPADLLAFAAFLVGAALVGGLAGRLSDRARDATNRLSDLNMLFEASRALSAALTPRDAAERLVAHFERAGVATAVWLNEQNALSLTAVSQGHEMEAQCMRLDPQELNQKTPQGVFALETGGSRLGAVAMWPRALDGKREGQWVAAMLELGAVAIDRARLAGEVTEASIVAEKEGLRTALLSSLSHDLRTPIASILASAGSLREHGPRFDEATRSEMLETIEHEADRLNRYVSNLLEMTRLESGALQVKSVLLDPGEAMSSAFDRVAGRVKNRRVLRLFAKDAGRIMVDPVLIEQAIVNILENAVAHSPASSTIAIGIRNEGKSVLLSVEDEGPGIPPGDLERVFDKFFRAPSDRSRGAGVGLGLSVARGLVEAFGGDIRAISPAAGDKGARVEIRLPSYPALEGVA